jgi:hypothetical protein
MAVSLPNGSLVAIGSAYGAAKTISALTNASPAVATSTAHGFTEGDIVVLTSGWSRLNGKTVRVGTVPTADTFQLEDIDTSSTTLYPAGSGVGTAKEVTTFTQLSQILSSATNGGEQQFLEYQFLEADAQTRIPTFKSAAGLTFSIADDPTLAGYIAAAAANDDREARALRVSLANGSFIYYNAFVSLNKTPSLTVNELMAVEVTLSFLNEPVRYAD